MFLKKIISIALLSFSISVCRAEDPLVKAIQDADDEKIAQMTYYYELIKNNKKEYKEKAQEILEQCHPCNQSRLSFSNAFHSLKGLIYFGLAGISFIAAKEAYTGVFLSNDENPGTSNPKLSGLFGSIGLGLGIAGLSEISKVCTNHDNLLKYYRALAIKEKLSKIE